MDKTTPAIKEMRPILSAIGISATMMDWTATQAIEALSLDYHTGNAVYLLWHCEGVDDLKRALWHLDRIGGDRFHVFARGLIRGKIEEELGVCQK
jgi:hypothetical protein